MYKRTILLLVFAAPVLGLMSGLVMMGLWKVFTTAPIREIPPGKASRIFTMVAGHELPRRKEDLRAVLWDTMDPAIFVRFRSDADGTAYIIRTFGGADAKPVMLDAEALRRQGEAGWKPFWELEDAEKKWGVPHLFDMGQVKSALSLVTMVGADPFSHGVHRTYRILIDTENNVVYMMAIRVGPD